MTAENVEQAIRDAGCGWKQLSQGLALTADSAPFYCNRNQCEALAQGATRSGSTPENVGAAALAFVQGNKAPMRALLAP